MKAMLTMLTMLAMLTMLTSAPAPQSFGDLPHRPLLVDLTVEEGQRLKVIYGSCAGFHAIDVDSGNNYDIYIPVHVSGRPAASPAAGELEPRPGVMSLRALEPYFALCLMARLRTHCITKTAFSFTKCTVYIILGYKARFSLDKVTKQGWHLFITIPALRVDPELPAKGL